MDVIQSQIRPNLFLAARGEWFRARVDRRTAVRRAWLKQIKQQNGGQRDDKRARNHSDVVRGERIHQGFCDQIDAAAQKQHGRKIKRQGNNLRERKNARRSNQYSKDGMRGEMESRAGLRFSVVKATPARCRNGSCYSPRCNEVD
jgi:hypothetical protein